MLLLLIMSCALRLSSEQEWCVPEGQANAEQDADCWYFSYVVGDDVHDCNITAFEAGKYYHKKEDDGSTKEIRCKHDVSNMSVACPCIGLKDCVTALKGEIRNFKSASTACLLSELAKKDNSTEQDTEGNITTTGIRASPTIGGSTTMMMSTEEFDPEAAYKELL
ncbi:hypothetical protein Aduo_011245 [Ancylostoma duodenale]